MLLWVAAALLLLGLLLAVPAELAFSVQRHETTRAQFSVVWLFGLVRFPIRSRQRAPKKKKPARKPVKKRKSRGQWRRRVLTALRMGSLRRRLWKFLRDTLRAITLRDLDMRLRYGFDDPCDTGLLWGYASPLVALLRTLSQVRVEVDLDFEEELFEFQASGSVRVVPARLLSPAVLFVASPVTLRAAWAIARA